MTSRWYDILAVLGSSKLTDILVPSWLDRSASRAITYFGSIFLQLDDGRSYLRVASVNNSGGLAWSQVRSPPSIFPSKRSTTMTPQMFSPPV